MNNWIGMTAPRWLSHSLACSLVLAEQLLNRLVWRTLFVALGFVGASSAAFGQVTVNGLTLPTNVGRGQDVNVSIGWTRTSAVAAVISTPVPPQVQVQPPALPGGCVLNAGAIDCTVPAGVNGDAGTIVFQVRGAVVGGFNMTATATGGSNASGSSNVSSAGDLTVTKTQTSPAGNPLAGQSTVFGLTPNVAAGADDIPVGAMVVVTDNLPGTSTDFNLTGVSPTGLAPSCNSAAAANTSRVLTCTYTGPFTVAALNASTITLTGTPGNSGGFTNVGSIASGNVNYFDSNSSNNISNLNYTVTPATDLQAQGNFPAAGVLVGSSQVLTLTYRNNGPLNAPAGGTISTTIPAGFVIGVLPAGCLSSGAGPFAITCTAGAVTDGNTQAFAIPLTMPGTDVTGNFPVSIGLPAGFGDANLGNNTVNVPYNVVLPYADLRASKTKGPGGAQPPGTVVTTTMTITNDASSPSAAAYTVAEPLRIVDFLKPEEVAGDAIASVSAGWSCTVTPGVNPLPAFIAAGRTTRVACQSTDVGSLAIGASRSVSFSSTITLGGSLTPIALPNTACTGGNALIALGLTLANAAQPADTNTGNDCANDNVNLVVTPVIAGQAQASVQKLSSVDNATFLDPVGSAPTLLGDASTVYWRMIVTTPSLGTNAGQVTIPTLRLSDTIPGRQNVSSTGSPAPSYVTPAITVTTTPNTYGVCPNLVAGNSGSLNCSFTNVPAGTVIQIDLAVNRPMASSTLTNTATLSSPDAVLSAAAGGQLSDSAAVIVAPRVDVALTTKTVTPATPRIGELVQFTITAQNLGPDDVTAASQFTVTDTLNTNAALAQVSYEVLSASGTGMDCSASNLGTGAISCTNTSALARYAVRTITISARLKKPTVAMPNSGNVFTGQINKADVILSGGYCEFKTEVVNPGGVSTSCNDGPSVSNNTKSISFDVQVPVIDMKQRKARVLPAGQSVFGLGDQLRYRFRIQANGPSRAEGIVMTDQLVVAGGYFVELAGVGAFPRTVTPLLINGNAAEAGYTLDGTKTASVRCTQASANADVICQLSSVTADNFMDAAKEVNFELLFDMTPNTATAPVSFGNRAYTCADETAAYESEGACSPIPGIAKNNLESVNDTVFPKNDLEVLSKTTFTPSPADINQPIRFDIVMRNNGPSVAVKMRMRDTLPTGLEWVSGGGNVPVATVNGGSTATLGGALTVSGAVPANGTPNVCFISNGTSSLTTLVQQQQITCDIAGNFPAGIGDTITVSLYARAKSGLYDGSAAAPYLSDRTNSVTVFPGQDSAGDDISKDFVAGNNTKTSVTQIRTAQIAGRTFLDLNNNGDQNGTIAGADQGLGNVSITLTGTDAYGYPVSSTVLTSNAALGAGSLRGDYAFLNLPPSNGTGYTITQTQPAGYGNGTPVPNSVRAVRNGVSTGVTGPFSTNNTVAPDTSVISGVVLSGGGNGVQFDFPEIQKPSVSGFVYLDADNNGVKGAGETGLNGTTVTLLGCRSGTNGIVDTLGPIGAGPVVCTGDDVAVNLVVVTATDATFGAGYYRFNLDEPGRYSVIEQVAQPVSSGVTTLRGKTTAGSVDLVTSGVGSNDGGTRGTINTTASPTGGTAGVLQEINNTVPASQIRDVLISNSAAVSVNNNFGETLPARLSGVVYTERGAVNSNFTGGTDWPLPGVTVTLTGTDDLGQVVNLNAVTDASGAYAFSNLRPGTYQVSKVNPAGITNELLGAFPGKDAGNVTQGVRVDDNTINTISLVSGAVVANTNFAVTNGPPPDAVIAAYIYVDSNRNHSPDASEIKRISGVTVNLVQGASCEAGVVLATQKSDANGGVYFTGQIGQDYLICEIQPPEYGNGNANGVPGSNSIAVTNLSQGGSYGNSIGEWVGSIKGSVYEDFGSPILALNNNGVRDAGEKGVAGVPIQLTGNDLNGHAVSFSTVTDINGNYLFDDLVTSDLAGYTIVEGVIPTVAGTYIDGKDTTGNASVAAGNAILVNDRISGIRIAPAELAVGYNFGELAATILPDLVVNKTTTTTRVGEGQVLSYTLNVKNTGQSATEGVYTVTDTLPTTSGAPAKWTLESATGAGWTCAITADKLSVACSHSTVLQPGETNLSAIALNVKVGVGAAAFSPLRNVVQVTGGGEPEDKKPQPPELSAPKTCGANPEFNVCQLETPVDQAKSDMVVTKAASKTVFTESNLGAYVLRVKNAGSAATSGVYTVTDSLPATSGTPSKWTIDSASGNGWICKVSADKLTVSCEASAVLQPGMENPSAIAVNVRIASGAVISGPLLNLVQVTGGGEPDDKKPTPSEVNSPPLCTADPVLNVCYVETPLQRAAGLSGHVWIDGGMKKVLDSSDKRLPQWIAEIYDITDPAAQGKTFAELVRGGLAMQTVTTDSQGYYEACNLQPNSTYRVLFRDPANRIAFPGVVTNEQGRVTSADYYSQVKDREGFQVLEVKLPSATGGPGCGGAGVSAPEQSLPLDPNGVVYDSRTRAPVPGSKVTLVPEGICTGYDPQLHIINYETYGKDAQGNPTMTTGSDGFYKFLLSGDPTAPKSCQFRLVLEPPAGYKLPPSSLIEPSGPLNTPAGPGIFEVQPQKPAPTGTQSTTYHFLFLTGLNHQEIFNNHLPLDLSIPGKLALTKQGDKRLAEEGDTVQYTLTTRLLEGDPVAQATVRDRLPAGFTLVPGTVFVNNKSAPDPLGGLGPVLAFNVGPMAANSQATVTYRVRVGVGAMQGDGINRARAHGCQLAAGCIDPVTLLPMNGAVESNEGQYKVEVTGGVFTDDACVLGKVYVDCNNNQIQDPEELGIPGVRLYFSDGQFVVSDSEGKYSRCGIPPRSHVLTPDPSTLPKGSRLISSSNRNLGDANSLFLDIKNGELHRADFIEGSCSNPVLEQVKARRTQGEVRSIETEKSEGPALKFLSKPLGYPQQGTDSANQPLVKPRSTGAQAQGASDAR